MITQKSIRWWFKCLLQIFDIGNNLLNQANCLIGILQCKLIAESLKYILRPIQQLSIKKFQ